MIYMLLVLLVLVYFIPGFVACMRDHVNGVAIIVLNFFLGWTLIGWVVALVWACTAQPSKTVMVITAPAPLEPRNEA